MRPAANRSAALPRALACVTAVFGVVAMASAHVIVNEFDMMTNGDAAWHFLWLGFTHIIPYGFDHILFVLSLYLLSPKLKDIVWQASAFTVAHSITLGLAMYGVIHPPPRIVEPLIALSIMAVAIENIIRPRLNPSRVAIVFFFGLVHGLGFAGALAELGLPKKHFLTTLVTFNAGVELGQLAVILIAYFAFGLWFSERVWYRRRIVIPISALIALIAGFWTVQRIFFLQA
ncbi:MAG: HupE/UreJ family protein [Flavobacteriales bacterium]